MKAFCYLPEKEEFLNGSLQVIITANTTCCQDPKEATIGDILILPGYGKIYQIKEIYQSVDEPEQIGFYCTADFNLEPIELREIMEYLGEPDRDVVESHIVADYILTHVLTQLAPEYCIGAEAYYRINKYYEE